MSALFILSSFANFWVLDVYKLEAIGMLMLTNGIHIGN